MSISTLMAHATSGVVFSTDANITASCQPHPFGLFQVNSEVISPSWLLIGITWEALKYIDAYVTIPELMTY